MKHGVWLHDTVDTVERAELFLPAFTKVPYCLPLTTSTVTVSSNTPRPTPQTEVNNSKKLSAPVTSPSAVFTVWVGDLVSIANTICCADKLASSGKTYRKDLACMCELSSRYLEKSMRGDSPCALAQTWAHKHLTRHFLKKKPSFYNTHEMSFYLN